MKAKYFSPVLMVLLMLLVPAQAFPGSAAMEDLLFMDIPVMVASKTASTLAEAPGIVSVISRQDIENLGARNLQDILTFVPGFVPAMDVQNAISYGLRGIYGMEGKILMLVDGLQMNDTIYGNPIFGASFFGDYIEKVEIIRGPGSALYGGFAELGVVNIISRGYDAKGGYASITYGQMMKANANRTINMGYGNRFGDLGLAFNAAVGDGYISDRFFHEKDDTLKSLGSYGGQKAWLADAALEYKGLEARFLGSYYSVDSPVGYGVPDIIPVSFASYTTDIKYKADVIENLKITADVSYNSQRSWDDEGVVAEANAWVYYYPSWVLKGNITAVYEFTKDYYFTAGAVYDHNETSINEYGSEPAYSVQDVQSYFGEFTCKLSLVNVTAGLRYDRNNIFGGAFAPRLVLAKQIGDFHFKAMANFAYRSPAVLNLYYQPAIKPEYTNDYEVELGYRLGNVMITLNGYDNRIRDVITYSEIVPYYSNGSGLGTQGVEAQLAWAEKWGSLKASYSTYRTVSNSVPGYTAFDSNGNSMTAVNFGFPSHKVTLAGSFKILDMFSVNPSMFFLSQRNIEFTDPATLALAYRELAPVAVTNIVFSGDIIKGALTLSAGCYNIFDAYYVLAPGYNNDDQETPSSSREYLLKLSYKF